MSSNLSATSFKAPQTSEAWINLFFDACKSGDLAVVKKLCSSELKAIADIHADDERGFQYACANGHLDIVKFFTTSPELIVAGHTFVDIHAGDELGFLRACFNGHLEIIKFLTTSPELLEAGHTFVDIHAGDELGFHLACKKGYLEVVKFLTTSPELLEAGHTFVDIHTKGELGFQLACDNDHLEIVKFLTTAPELLEAGHTFVDIHANDEQGFQLACENAHWNVIEFLIFDLKIEQTSAIDIIIKKCPQVQELFRVREEQEEIQQSFESRSTLETPTSQDQKINSVASFRI